MEDKRKGNRTPIEQKAHYHLQGEEDWKECTVVDWSLDGMGITFYTRKQIEAGSTIHLKVFFHSGPKSIDVKGTLRWVKQREKGFIGGIEVIVKE